MFQGVIKGAELYNPKADAAFVPALKEFLKPEVSVSEVQAELNSEQFACVLVNELLGMIN